jgi:alcohol dehydrogenase
MKAVVVDHRAGPQYTDVPDPGIERDGDAIVAVTASTLCGTDLHFGKRLGKNVSAPYVVMGHEFVGVVREVGRGVHQVAVGDRCAAAMFASCGECVPCGRREFFGCVAAGLFGKPTADHLLQGGQAEFVRIPFADRTLIRIPESMPDEEAVLLSDVLPTAHTALLAARLIRGGTVCVVGLGPVGRAALLLAENAFGASRMVAVDRSPYRARLVAGSSAVTLGDTSGAGRSRYHSSHEGVDVAIEAAGNAAGLRTALRSVRLGGSVAAVGFLQPELFPVALAECHRRCLSIDFVIGDPMSYRAELLDLVTSGAIRLTDFVSHEFPLAEAEAAYRLFRSRRALKVLLRPS